MNYTANAQKNKINKYLHIFIYKNNYHKIVNEFFSNWFYLKYTEYLYIKLKKKKMFDNK